LRVKKRAMRNRVVRSWRKYKKNALRVEGKGSRGVGEGGGAPVWSRLRRRCED
jgi:hypothetical protein